MAQYVRGRIVDENLLRKRAGAACGFVYLRQLTECMSFRSIDGPGKCTTLSPYFCQRFVDNKMSRLPPSDIRLTHLRKQHFRYLSILICSIAPTQALIACIELIKQTEQLQTAILVQLCTEHSSNFEISFTPKYMRRRWRRPTTATELFWLTNRKLRTRFIFEQIIRNAKW